MASTRVSLSDERTTKRLQESTDVGNYHLFVPGNGESPFYFDDPHIRMQKWGGNLWSHPVDVDSYCKGIDRRSKPFDLQEPRALYNIQPFANAYPSSKALHNDHCRHSNPAWNLRDAELPRSEYVLYDPQIKAHIPFTHNVSSRIYEKDLWDR